MGNCAGPKLVLTRAGEAEATIVLGTRQTDADAFAAQELQRYMARISGATIPIAAQAEQGQGAVILIGTLESNEPIGQMEDELMVGGKRPAAEGFLIKTLNGKLIIAGADGPGVVYGVYTFLEMLGCRWFGPSEEYEEVPCNETIVVSEIEVLEEPAFKRREIRSTGWWGIKNKLNYVSVAELGDRVYQWGFKQPSPILHCFSQLLPHDKYFESHPEWYPVINGKRSSGEGHSRGKVQLCVSNEQMRAEFARNLAAMMAAHPHADTWEIYPMDMSLGWCECEHCRALDESDPMTFNTVIEKAIDESSGSPRRWGRRYMVFINDIARRVGKVHPDRKVVLGAYTGKKLGIPPRDLELAENVAVSSTITAQYCIKHDINSRQCDENTRYARILDTWLQRCDDVYLYDYLWKVVRLDLPYPIHRKVISDYRYYKRVGLTGFRSQGSTDHWGTQGLLYYVAARMMWNPDTDAEALLDDYFRGFYKEACEPMKKFHETLEQALRKAPADPVFSPWIPLTTAQLKQRSEPLVVFSAEALQQCDGQLRQAESVARDEQVLKRVHQARVSLDYTKLLTKVSELVQMKHFREPSAADRRQTKEALEALVTFVEEHADKGVFHANVARRDGDAYRVGWGVIEP